MFEFIHHGGFYAEVCSPNFYLHNNIVFYIPPITINTHDLDKGGNWKLTASRKSHSSSIRIRVFDHETGFAFGFRVPGFNAKNENHLFDEVNNLFQSKILIKNRVYKTFTFERANIVATNLYKEIDDNWIKENVVEMLDKYNEKIKSELGDFRVKEDEQTWWPYNCPPEMRLTE